MKTQFNSRIALSTLPDVNNLLINYIRPSKSLEDLKKRLSDHKSITIEYGFGSCHMWVHDIKENRCIFIVVES